MGSKPWAMKTEDRIIISSDFLTTGILKGPRQDPREEPEMVLWHIKRCSEKRRDR